MAASSFFASLGAALQAFPYPRLHLRTPVTPLGASPFETRLAALLQDLGDKPSLLTLPGLCCAMAAVLSTHSCAQAFAPDLRGAISDGGDTAWLDTYLDESVKLLDICNLLREAVWAIRNYQALVELALRALESRSPFLGEAQLRKASRALAECGTSLKRKDDGFGQQGQRRSKLETSCSILRRMGEKLNPEDASKGGFFSAIYAAQITTIFVCSLLSAALCFKPRRPYSTMAIAGHSSWALTLTGLQQRVREQIEKRKAKGSAALLEELDRTDVAVRECKEIAHKLLAEKCFPLGRCEEQELMHAVANLRISGNALAEGLNPLEQHISDLFTALVASRMELLDIYSYSYRPKM